MKPTPAQPITPDLSTEKLILVIFAIRDRDGVTDIFLLVMIGIGFGLATYFIRFLKPTPAQPITRRSYFHLIRCFAIRDRIWVSLVFILIFDYSFLD